MYFCRLIGIPNGSDDTLFNIFRFTDDLCDFNNDEFENNSNDIYTDELELKKQIEDPFRFSTFEC